MRIEVLGPGCARCQTLAGSAKAAIEELGLDCEVVKVTDMDEIVNRGVVMTPALVIDGVVKTIGKVTSVKEIRELLL
jgi:small redox-active disulfide protein 2